MSEWTSEMERESTRRQLLTIRLGHIKAAHERLIVEIATRQEALMELPASELSDLPVERKTQYRFTGLMNDANAMRGRWSNLAHEYELLAELVRELCDADEDAKESDFAVEPEESE